MGKVALGIVKEPVTIRTRFGFVLAVLLLASIGLCSIITRSRDFYGELIPSPPASTPVTYATPVARHTSTTLVPTIPTAYVTGVSNPGRNIYVMGNINKCDRYPDLYKEHGLTVVQGEIVYPDEREGAFLTIYNCPWDCVDYTEPGRVIEFSKVVRESIPWTTEGCPLIR